jgi:hypothetical protein
MAVTISLLALLAVTALIIVLRRNNSRATDKPSPARPIASGKSAAFHAVSIRLGPNACRPAQEMSGKRFLSGAAPRIPFPECDVLECKCRFVHHEDRREGDDRRNPFDQGIATKLGNRSKDLRTDDERRNSNTDDTY